ncbi:MAG: hypothetical protein KA184_15715 [Candidatus Hydrogenedentes bacterium]|nr:hypothetical protein [Candidatus Hydrogenedentota bacterium]
MRLTGIGAVAAFTVAASVVLRSLTRALAGLRVTPEVACMGLDKSEMGLEAHPEDATTAEYKYAGV